MKNTAPAFNLQVAGSFLSPDEATVEEMVKAIRNHADQEDFIDLVADVTVWQPVEWSITCKNFLETIEA